MALSAGTAFVDVLADMSKFAASVAAGVTKNQAALKKVGTSMTKFITLPILAAGVASVKLAADFEHTMDQIIGLAGKSQQQVDAWSKDILALGPELGKAPRELAEALYFVASSGVDAAQAMDVVTISAKASAAGLGDTQVVADAVTSAMNAYASSGLSASEATDVLTQAVKLGKGEADAMAPVLGSLLPTAAELDVSFQDVAASLAAMTTTGDSASIAATKINAIMSALLKVTPQSAQAFKDVGLNVDDLRNSLGEEGLLPTLQLIKTAVGDDTAALAAMFPNVRALRGVLSLTGENAANVTEIFRQMDDSLGATDEAFKAVTESAEFKFNQAMAQVQTTAIEIGSVILPAVTSAVGALAGAFEFIGELSPEMQKFLAQVLGIAAAVGPMLIIMSKMPGVFHAMATGAGQLGAAFTFLATHPVVAALAAIAAISIAVVSSFNDDEEAAKKGKP